MIADGVSPTGIAAKACMLIGGTIHPPMIDDFDYVQTSVSAMANFSRPWCVCGGWGIDLWLEQITRQHRQIRIAILRQYQVELLDYLHEWTFEVATLAGGFVPLKTGRQMLMLPVSHLRATDRIGRSMDIYLSESDGIDWIYWRNFDVRVNLSNWCLRTREGVPVLCPQIELLIKSHAPDFRDELDMRCCLDRLDEPQRTWLKLSLLRCQPDHPWLALL